MQRTGNASPEVKMQAETYVGTGYQRLLTFEVAGGGFSLFGNAPAQVFLTAYGLMEFSDMAKVYPVDEALLKRTAQWLLDRQATDGTWGDRGYSEHWQIDSQAPTTAYIVWSLIEAGYEDSAEVGRAISRLRESALQQQDAYSLALVANALAAYDPNDAMTKAAADRLNEMRVQEGDVVYWATSAASFMGATGKSGSLETTALAAMALMRAGMHPDTVTGALAYLVRGKDAWGTWSTTQATILSLKALLLSTEKAGQAAGSSTVRISLNQEQTTEIAIDDKNADVVHLVAFDHGFSPGGANRVQIELQGGGNLIYQVVTRYYLPWGQVPPVPDTEEMIAIELSYDRTALAVNDEVTVNVRASLSREGTAKMTLIDLGVPPGFTVMTEDLARLVEQKGIARYELTGRQIIVYLEDLTSDKPVAFSYRLRARFPMRALTPPSSAYDYYNPSMETVKAPLGITVSE